MKKSYWLYGVSVTKEFYYSDKTQLDPAMILTEQNAQRRMMLIQLIGINKIIDKLSPQIIQEMSADELYKRNPIGNYLQQGDVLVKPNSINPVNYPALSDKMREILPNIHYRLIDIKMDNEVWRYLDMQSASHTQLRHIEGVPIECNTIYEALCWRNKVKFLPYELS